MDETKVARGLGWLSIGLGLAEIVAGRQVGRVLGMEDKCWLIRLFGVREAATGVAILARENPTAGVWARVGGDVLDLAALGSGFGSHNPKNDNLTIAFAAVAGITAIDYWCARRLTSVDRKATLETPKSFDRLAPHPRATELRPTV